MFSLIYVWINGWVNNREAGDLRRYRGHYYVIVMASRIRTKPQTFIYRSHVWRGRRSIRQFHYDVKTCKHFPHYGLPFAGNPPVDSHHKRPVSWTSADSFLLTSTSCVTLLQCLHDGISDKQKGPSWVYTSCPRTYRLPLSRQKIWIYIFGLANFCYSSYACIWVLLPLETTTHSTIYKDTHTYILKL